MKVAFISQPWNRVVPPVESGSVAIWNYQVARRLAPAFPVTIYAAGGDGTGNVARSDGVEYRYVATSIDRRMLRGLRHWSRLRSSKRSFFASGLYYLEYIVKVSLDLRKRHYDIVHIQNLSQFAPVVRALNPGVRILLHMHCEWLTQLDSSLIRPRLEKTDMIVGCSDYITEKIRRRFPSVASRCRTVYNGVDVRLNETRNGRKNGAAKRVLFVGRISPEKGLHVLLEAFQQVVRAYPDVELDIVGPQAAPPVAFIFKLSDDPKVAGLVAHCNGDYLTALKEQVPAELRQRVSFSGAIPHSVLAARYAAADIYVQPSLIEAFPLPIPEAMAAGVPVVGTRVGGIAEAITDRVTGRLVDSNDAETLAEAIVDLLSDEPSRRSMGQSARARALERFSWEHVAEDLLGVYQSMS